MKKNPTLYKTLSWLVISYLLICSTAWYESGNLTIGMWAALWACIIKTPVYWFHEAIWGKIIFKKHQSHITFKCSVCAEKVEEAIGAA